MRVICREKEIMGNRKKGRKQERDRNGNLGLTPHVGKMKTSREARVATMSETGGWTVMDL